MALSLKIRRGSLSPLAAGILLSVLFGLATPAGAQLNPSPSYQVEASASAVGENYLESRRKATRLGFRQAVAEALEDLLGSEVYRKREGSLGEILSRSQSYVRNYVYLEAFDDQENKVSSVKMEVALFIDALLKKLAGMGALSEKASLRSVIILIKEKSLSSSENAQGWDFVPVSEGILGKKFIEEGIKVVDRASIVGLVSDELISKAARGDISAAIDIGFKTGAEIVILGSAISSLIGNSQVAAIKTIQVNLSVKVISTTKSVVVAAKSNFAIAKSSNIVNGELEAFEKVTGKLSGFLLNSMERFWNPEPVASAKPDSSPAKNIPDNKPESKPNPMSMDDL